MTPQITALAGTLRASLCCVLSVLIAACSQNSPSDPEETAIGMPESRATDRASSEGNHQRGELTEEDLTSFRNFISGSEIRKVSQPTQNPFFERFYDDGRWEAQYAWTDITECAGTWSVDLNDDEFLQICAVVTQCSGRGLDQKLEECRTAVPDYSNGQMKIAPLGQEAFLEGASSTVSISAME